MSTPQTPKDLELDDPLAIRERTYPYGLFSALSLVLAVLLFTVLKEYYSGTYHNATDKTIESVVTSLFTISFTLAVLFLCLEFRKEILRLNYYIPKIRAYIKSHKKFFFAILGILLVGSATIIWICFGEDISDSITHFINRITGSDTKDCIDTLDIKPEGYEYSC